MGSAEVSALIEEFIRGLVAGEQAPVDAAPEEIQAALDDLAAGVTTYRDAALIVLAFAIDAGTGQNIADPPSGRRTVAKRVEELLDGLSIRARRDAFQTLAKGTDTLLGRDRPSWNELIGWGQQQDEVEPLQRAFGYLATRIALTARDLPPMPSIDVSQLTFRRTMLIIENLLGRPSGGAHEQYTFAALQQALAEELGGAGARVETKGLSASDASAGTAADVQILEGGRIREAYEVTANPWASKITQAAAVLRHYDLPRVHIVAPGPAPSADDIEAAVDTAALPAGLIAREVDISVLDVQEECRSLVQRLTRPGRRAALRILWEHLATKQPRDELVREYVELLASAGVVVDG